MHSGDSATSVKQTPALNHCACCLAVASLRFKACQALAHRQRTKGNTAPAQTSKFQRLQLHACVYPELTPLQEVALSSRCNTVSHSHVATSVLDELNHLLRLVDAHNAAAPADKRLSLTAANLHAQLNLLHNNLPLTSSAAGLAAHEKVAQKLYDIFSFCMAYGSPQTTLMDPALGASPFHTGQTVKGKEQSVELPLLLPKDWIAKIAVETKARIVMPTTAQLQQLKSERPWLRIVSLLADFLFARVTYCRDVSHASSTKTSTSKEDEPTLCKKADDVVTVTEQACAVYLQWMLALSKSH